VVSLGAGYDTTFWNLLDTDLQPAKYIEVDFPAVTRQKTHIIHGKRAQLLDKLGGMCAIHHSPLHHTKTPIVTCPISQQ